MRFQARIPQGLREQRLRKRASGRGVHQPKPSLPGSSDFLLRRGVSAFSVPSFHLGEKEGTRQDGGAAGPGWASILIRLKQPLNRLLGCAPGTWRGASCSQCRGAPEGQGLLETEDPSIPF